MLVLLAEKLEQYARAFNVFGYITLRAVLATMTALVISFVVGPRMIAWLTHMKIGQSVRDDGPQTHLSKAGTPTMGGALILVSIVVTTLLWGNLTNRFVWVVLLVTAGFGAIGWVDDWRKVVHRNPKGLSARTKFLWQSLIGLVAAVYLAFSVSAPDNAQFLRLLSAWVGSGFNIDLSPKANLIVPFFKTVSYPLGVWGFIALTFCVIVGTSNAVNLTDGLDGLAIMPTVMVGAALGIFAYVTSRADFSGYLFLPHIPGAGELTVICGAIAGAGLGFLWFNAYPADVFMGDVGALALGAALGTIAVIVRQEIVLFIMGGVFVVETLSVIVQVASFKMTGRRVFRMAPLHHHYELKGWKENQVVVRFWIITMLLVLFGLSTLKLALMNDTPGAGRALMRLHRPQCRRAGRGPHRQVARVLSVSPRCERARGRHPRVAAAGRGTRGAVPRRSARDRTVHRGNHGGRGSHRHQSRRGPAASGDCRCRGARRRAGRRRRTVRARAAAFAKGAGDHRLQRQVDRHGTRGRAVPRGGIDHRDRRQHRRGGARRHRAVRGGGTLARRVRARVVEFPAGDDAFAGTGRRGRAQRHRQPPRSLRGNGRLRARPRRASSRAAACRS